MGELVRFGIAVEQSLLTQFDAIVKLRGVTRSEIIRDLIRSAVARTQVREGVPALAALTLVYNHHIRDLTERLTKVQHALGERVNCALHVHLDADRCMEVIVLRGQSDELQQIAERLLATRGVYQGGIQVVPLTTGASHDHDRNHSHAHDHEAPAPRRRKRKN